MGSLIQPSPAHDVTVILRTVGERTQAAAYQLLAQQIPADQIFTIQEVPFTAAVQKTFTLGIEAGRRWTLAIDADVLVREDLIARLITAAEAEPETMFELQCMVLDRFFAGPRPAGIHLFRTAHCHKALPLVPAPGESNRPETTTIRRMAEAGHPYIQKQFVGGLHDFEQSYRDIYRKTFIYAHKHGRHVPYLERMWHKQAVTSDSPESFRVALLGLTAGQQYTGAVTIDVRHVADKKWDSITQAHAISARPPYLPDAALQRNIGWEIDTFVSPPEYWIRHHLVRSHYAGQKEKHGRWGQIQQLASQIGWPSAMSAFLQDSWHRISKRLR